MSHTKQILSEMAPALWLMIKLKRRETISIQFWIINCDRIAHIDWAYGLRPSFEILHNHKAKYFGKWMSSYTAILQ
jgi:hypothetical protein